jgi:uracil-DNA glycosylase
MTFNDHWDTLDWWNTGEAQVLEERYEELQTPSPRRQVLFESFKQTPFASVRVAIIGQDPYPDPRFCTGVAFSIPPLSKRFPSSLDNIFQVYQDDLHYPCPTSGDLTPWCKQGVFLWNAYPTLPRIEETTFLTKEVVERLSVRNIVFVLLGKLAQSLEQYIDSEINEVICLSHPSPLSAKISFLGSRMFSVINDKLVGMKHQPINWRLP